MDLTLNFNDKTISNTFLKDKDLIIQKVILSLQCWLGDWYLDGSYGVNYGVRLQNKGLLIADMEDIIKSVDGVTSVQDITIKTTYEGERFTQKVININVTLTLEDGEQFTLISAIPTVR